MVKDRTFEFRSSIENISNGLFPRASYPAIGSFGNDQFLDKASKISRELTKTSTKLDQLNKIAKNKSIFDDKPEEFDGLSNSIKRDLSELNRRTQELRGLASNTPTSPTNSTTSNKTVQEHQRNVILILQNWTAQYFKSFENILETRSQTLKSKKDRKDQFGSGAGDSSPGNNFTAFRSSTPPAAAPAPAMPKSSPSNSPLKQRPIDPTLADSGNPQNPFAQAPIRAFDTSQDYKKVDDHQSTHVSIDFSNQQQHQKQSLMMEQEPLLASDSRNLRARNNALGAIESTINELGTIYQQLAHLVAEQGETVQRIDYNVEDLSMNVMSGQNQLARYLRRVSSNRFLIAKIFMALIIFIIIFKFLFL